jgi:hypothetical protein
MMERLTPEDAPILAQRGGPRRAVAFVETLDAAVGGR